MSNQKKRARLDPPKDPNNLEIATQETEIPPTHSILIVAGTYERLLYGLVGKLENDSLVLEPRFIMPTHIGCITTVGIGGKFLASGSTDEVVKLFDLKRQKELGSLHEHTGTITKIEFYGSSHCLSAATDGSICIYRTKDWELLKILKGHLKEVTDISIHPTGRLAISVSRDRTAVLWNLLTGQKALRIKLKSVGELVRWNNAGDKYGIVSQDNTVSVYNVSEGKLETTFQASSHIHDFIFVDNPDFSPEENNSKELLIIGGQDKHIHVVDPSAQSSIGTVQVHDNRIKGISKTTILRENKPINLIVTVSSDSKVKVWELDSLISAAKASEKIKEDSEKEQVDSKDIIQPLGMYNAGCRLTCVVATTDPLSK
ncbi:hypothetical protein BB559_007511 [Furculomyces boomerangus]|uniref:Uncharacterized protein n=2 Tax=Harpellales TaxID=61421 RepID=A0A2T9XX43_9FUNG|nr:hypothetical protein BB559_007511 [Furculomyces boomerangus]PWA00821.1 hypothetical protein BB558_003120 [Smittium angustum]